MQALHLLAEYRRVAPIPSVGEHHHDRAARHAALAPLVVERSETVTEAGAAPVVGDPLGRSRQRLIGVARRELAGEPGEPGAERERLDLLAAGDCGVHEADQGSCIRLHRSTHVEQQHQPAGAQTGALIVPTNRFAARPHRGPNRAAQIGAIRAPGGGGEPQRSARRADQSELAHQLLGLDQLVRRVLGEILPTKYLGGAEAQFDHRIVRRLCSVGLIVVVVVVVVVDRQRDVERFLLDRQVDADRGLLPEHAKRAVVQFVIFRAPHERGPTCPEHRVPIAQPDGRQRLAERDGGAGRDVDPGSAKHPAEGDRQFTPVAGGGHGHRGQLA